MTSLPDSMIAITITVPGGPQVLRAERKAVPSPGEREILIRVTAAGVNRPDVLQRAGFYPPPKGASDLLGLEVAGEVVETGSGVERWKPGDRVCALTPGGCYAEFALVDESNALPVPDLGPFNIRVNTLLPGWVMTERQRREHLTPEGEARIDALQAIPTRIQPDDIAAMALFLAADDSALCTSQEFIVDGGWI